MTATTDDDRPLIEAAQADPARFAELYDRYVDRVYAFVSRRTHDRAAAEDITSEVFQQALAAGAKSLSPPTDQGYGDRVAAVEDSIGNHWFIARPA